MCTLKTEMIFATERYKFVTAVVQVLQCRE